MSWWRFAIFGTVMGALSLALHRYLWARLVRDVALPDPWGRLVTVALVAFALLIPVVMIASRALPRPVVTPLAWVAFTWMGLFFLLFAGTAAGDVVRMLTGALETDEAKRLTMRRIIAGGVGLFAVVGGAIALFEGNKIAAVKPVRVALKKLPASMNGLKIVQISDVHIGPTLGHDWLAGIVARINALAPDAVVITGDLVDGSVEELRAHTAPLADLKAPLGVFFVTGNHEYYSGADAWIAELRRLGVRVLRNERVELRRGEDVLDLIGIDDATAHQFGRGHGADLQRAIAGRDDGRESILLAHQPKQAAEAAGHGVGLVLSGHTHGGQIWPFTFLVRLQQPYNAGLYRDRDTQIYVSRGTGYWGPPMRLGAPAEITQLELVRG
jgi:predicted MPP superfamily phosphohydrolase